MSLKVKDLLKLLLDPKCEATLKKDLHPDCELLVRLDGSIYPTDNFDEHGDYNNNSSNEVFILALEEFED